MIGIHRLAMSEGAVAQGEVARGVMDAATGAGLQIDTSIASNAARSAQRSYSPGLYRVVADKLQQRNKHTGDWNPVAITPSDRATVMADAILKH